VCDDTGSVHERPPTDELGFTHGDPGHVKVGPRHTEKGCGTGGQLTGSDKLTTHS